MPWVVLVISGAFEAVWATALGNSDGLRRLGPSVLFLLGVAASLGGLAYSMRTLPAASSYVVWVGVGAVLTVAYAVWTGEETLSTVKMLLLAGIIACVVGLKTLP